MMVAAFDVTLRNALAVLALERPLRQWKHIADDEIAIPHYLVEVAAFFRYVDRGRVHGYDVPDYLKALVQFRQLFREVVDTLVKESAALEMTMNDDDRLSDDRRNGPCASGGPDTPECYLQNRNAVPTETAAEALEFPGWYAIRSLGGIRTYGRIRSLDELPDLLKTHNLTAADVVIHPIASTSFDASRLHRQPHGAGRRPAH